MSAVVSSPNHQHMRYAEGALKMTDMKMADHQNVQAWIWWTWIWRTKCLGMKSKDMKMGDKF